MRSVRGRWIRLSPDPGESASRPAVAVRPAGRLPMSCCAPQGLDGPAANLLQTEASGARTRWPLPAPQQGSDSCQMLETWLRSYPPGRNCSMPAATFDRRAPGPFRPRAPGGMDRAPHAMAACLRRKLRLPPIEAYGGGGWSHPRARSEHEKHPTESGELLARPPIDRNPDWDAGVRTPGETSRPDAYRRFEEARRVWIGGLLPEECRR